MNKKQQDMPPLHPSNVEGDKGVIKYVRKDVFIEKAAECKDLDELVIRLEETIGTSPHSRDTIKEFFQKAIEIAQKPAEWSEEDEKMLCDVIKDLVHPWDEYIPDRIEEEIKWLKNKLKSLRPQTTLKPSDEQMAELRRVISGCSYDIEPLVEMEEQLKKL